MIKNKKNWPISKVPLPGILFIFVHLETSGWTLEKKRCGVTEGHTSHVYAGVLVATPVVASSGKLPRRKPRCHFELKSTKRTAHVAESTKSIIWHMRRRKGYPRQRGGALEAWQVGWEMEGRLDILTRHSDQTF